VFNSFGMVRFARYLTSELILELGKVLRDDSGFEHIGDILGPIQLRIRRVIQEPARRICSQAEHLLQSG
jgi:hypothetical protein